MLEKLFLTVFFDRWNVCTKFYINESFEYFQWLYSLLTSVVRMYVDWKEYITTFKEKFKGTIDTIDENKKIVWCLNTIMAVTVHVRLPVAVVSTSEWK